MPAHSANPSDERHTHTNSISQLKPKLNIGSVLLTPQDRFINAAVMVTNCDQTLVHWSVLDGIVQDIFIDDVKRI